VEKGITIMKSEVNIMEPPQCNFKEKSKKKSEENKREKKKELYRLNLECRE
jgi:hypothetical protein